MQGRIRQASNTAAPRPGVSRTTAFPSRGRPRSVPRRRTRSMQAARRAPITVDSSPCPATHRDPPASGRHEHARRESGPVAAAIPHAARSGVRHRASVRLDCMACMRNGVDLRQWPARATRAANRHAVDAAPMPARTPPSVRAVAMPVSSSRPVRSHAATRAAVHSNRHAARGSAASVSLDSFRMPSKLAWLSAGQNAASVMPSGRVYSTLNTALFSAMKLA